MSIAILYSGGLDSFIMNHYAKVVYPNSDVRCLWFDIGQPYNAKEEAALPAFVEKRKLEWLRRLDDKGNWVGEASGEKGKGNETGQIYIPGRNAVLITQAACLTLADEIWLGALQGEVHPGATDKNFTFLRYVEDMLAYTLSPFRKVGRTRVRYPLASAGFSKLTSVQWALANGATKEELMATSSCLSGESGNCGHCVVCFRRWGIFKQCGFSEDYNVHPLTVLENKKIVLEMLKGEQSYYDKFRRDEILPALDSDYIGDLVFHA